MHLFSWTCCIQIDVELIPVADPDQAFGEEVK